MALQPTARESGLTPDRWAAVERIFHAALECDFDLRPAYVHEACGSDLELRAQVE